MTTTIVTPNQDAIASEIQIAAPPERVFRALTDAGELQRWFGSPECPLKFWQMDARVGGRLLHVAQCSRAFYREMALRITDQSNGAGTAA